MVANRKLLVLYDIGGMPESASADVVGVKGIARSGETQARTYPPRVFNKQILDGANL